MTKAKTFSVAGRSDRHTNQTTREDIDRQTPRKRPLSEGAVIDRVNDEPPLTGVWAGSGGVSPKVFPGETSSPPHTADLLSYAISTSERLAPLI